MQGILFNKIIKKFYNNKKYKFYILFLLSIVAGLFEYLGLILIFQFILFLSNPNASYCQKIILFFKENLNIYEFSKISLILGLATISIYILKNIYMLIFTKINNNILEDLSVKITLKILKNITWQDYITVNSISESEKLNIISKITIVVWQYCLKYINLITNLTVATILVGYLFIKFTICALVACIFILILAIIGYLYLKNQSNYQNKNFNKSFDSINKILLTIINSIKEIKLNKKEEFFFKKFEKSMIKYAALNKNRCFNNVFHIYFTEISIMCAFALVLFVLFFTSNFNNSIILTSICTICIIILRLTPAINRAQSCLYSINSNKKIVEELLEFDDKFKNITIPLKTDEFLPFEKIKLNNICFSYKNSKKSLNNVNIEINKGDFIGIVGENGSYKTTLALIIAGIIKPKSGELATERYAINEKNIQKWQNNISFLSQNYGLIFDNIYENIALNEDYDIKNIKNFIKDYDFNFIIDENKNTEELSEGQKQKIALYSTLYQNKNIIILDEATSSIDLFSEEKINLALKKLQGKKTIISIAHRLQTLKNCNKIIFINNDGTVNFDTFHNLERTNKDFMKIINLLKSSLI